MSIPDFAIVTAATEPYLKKLQWCLPTWAMKPQFAGRKLYVFHHGLKYPSSQIFRMDELTDAFDITLIDWTMPKYADVRELMLSSFVLGAAQHVTEPYFVKLDADCFFLDRQDAFLPEDFKVDLCAHRWGYTKPGWWYDKLEAWTNGKRHRDRSDTGARGHKRIISWCCLHRTEFVRQCARAAGDRLPIPSHDSFLWYMAERFSDVRWKAVNLKSRGVNHASRWRSIRENICANETAWNPYLNDVLMRHVQLELTTACNMGCHNCDRCCGVAPSNEMMSVKQVVKFVAESLNASHQWDRIDLLGGEPTLHPEIGKILDAVKVYKDAYPKCQIRFTTNGNGRRVNRVLRHIPAWIHVRNSAKESKSQAFDAFNCAPVDEGVEKAKGCSIPWRCGISLTRYGFFPCGAGASIGRVFGVCQGIRALSGVNPGELKTRMEQLCNLCGHSLSTRKEATEQLTSPTWQKAIDAYKQSKPALELY